MKDRNHQNLLRLVLHGCSLIFLFLFFSYMLTIDKPNLGELDLLKLDSPVVFGSELNKTPLTLNLTEDGEAAIAINSSPFNAEDFSQLEYSILHLGLNYQTTLVWVNSKSDEVYELKLMQSHGGVQYQPLQPHKGWSNQIKQLGIRISPQDHLGLSVSDNQNIVVSVLKLGSINFNSSINSLWNHWWNYDHWSYKSINHLRHEDHWPWFTHPLIFLTSWLFFGLLLEKFFFNKTPFTFKLFIFAWVVLDLLFLYDLSKSSLWSNQFYSSSTKTSTKTLPDKELKSVAEKVQSIINNLKGDKQEPRVYVQSNDRYVRSRLIYHMIPINTSYIDYRPQIQYNFKQNDYILFFKINIDINKFKSEIVKIKGEDVPVSIESSGENFALLRVKSK